MKNGKYLKTYNTPELIVYGDVSKITAQYGHTVTDVPQGTAADGPGGPCGS